MLNLKMSLILILPSILARTENVEETIEVHVRVPVTASVPLFLPVIWTPLLPNTGAGVLSPSFTFLFILWWKVTNSSKSSSDCCRLLLTPSIPLVWSLSNLSTSSLLYLRRWVMLCQIPSWFDLDASRPQARCRQCNVFSTDVTYELVFWKLHP